MTKIIAELGINHQGSLGTAKKLIDMCFDVGVDYVKFQKRNPKESTPKSEWDKPKQTPWGTTEKYIDYRKKMEFDLDEFDEINEYCSKKNMKWFMSVFDLDSLDFCIDYYSEECEYVKIPSCALTNIAMLKKAKTSGLKIIISTGMSTLTEIMTAFKVFSKEDQLTVLSCTSTYPTPDQEVNLNKINTLKSMAKDLFKEEKHNWTFGFSNHSSSPYPAIYSAVLGADIIEAHVTLDRTMIGSDHSASLEKPGLDLLVREVSRIPTLLGDGIIKVYNSEVPFIEKLRIK